MKLHPNSNPSLLAVLLFSSLPTTLSAPAPNPVAAATTNHPSLAPTPPSAPTVPVASATLEVMSFLPREPQEPLHPREASPDLLHPRQPQDNLDRSVEKDYLPPRQLPPNPLNPRQEPQNLPPRQNNFGPPATATTIPPIPTYPPDSGLDAAISAGLTDSDPAVRESAQEWATKYSQTTYYSCVQNEAFSGCGWHRPIVEIQAGGGGRSTGLGIRGIFGVVMGLAVAISGGLV